MENKEDTTTPKYGPEWQSSVSAGLIAGIIITLILFLNVTYSTEDERFFQVPVISGMLTILMGVYIFVYRGRGHVAARIFFIISLIITTLIIFGLIFMIGLGEAFQH